MKTELSCEVSLTYLIFTWIVLLMSLLFKMFQDQMRALETITKDPELASLKIIQAPVVDVEIMGVAGLKFMGDLVWK